MTPHDRSRAATVTLHTAALLAALDACPGDDLCDGDACEGFRLMSAYWRGMDLDDQLDMVRNWTAGAGAGMLQREMVVGMFTGQAPRTLPELCAAMSAEARAILDGSTP